MFLYLLFCFLVIFAVVKTIHPSECLVSVKQRYEKLRGYIKNNNVPKKFKVLEKPILISGFTRSSNDVFGYNINKGQEISICVDGTPNQAFHVLIHELAHSTVDEYSHSPEFWENFSELKKICQSIGIYQPIDKQTSFCGKYIRD